MPDYYIPVEGSLEAGQLAKAEDIRAIETSVQDSEKNMINDLYDHTSFVLGSAEDAFVLSPAPKKGGRYIDTMNIVPSDKENWLSIKKYGYKQKIRKGKTSLYSIIVKLRNLHSKPIIVWFELRDPNDNDILLKKSSIQVPPNITGSEFEVVFDQEFLPTSTNNIDVADASGLPILNEDSVEEIDDDYLSDDTIDGTDDNNGLGFAEYDLIIRPLNINVSDLTLSGDEDIDLVDDDSFAILADNEGAYGQRLYKTGNNGGLYDKLVGDLYFKDIYATTNTYLCVGGQAVIDGQAVPSLNTHVSIDGVSSFGNVKTLVYMDNDGHYQAVNSNAFFGDDEDPEFDEVIDGAKLPIAYITTYMGDTKQPIIDQSILPRSHHEDIRRLKKQMAHQKDFAMPPRLKYRVDGMDIINPYPETLVNPDLVGDYLTAIGNANKIEVGGDFFLTTDAKGNFVIKAVDAVVVNIPVTFKGDLSVSGKKDIALAQSISSQNNVKIDTKKGIVELSTAPVKNETTTTTSTKGLVATTKAEAKKTIYNPWDDYADNRPKNSKITPTNRKFTIHKGAVNSNISQFPAMTFYTGKKIKLTGLTIPITTFSNMSNVRFVIWKRQNSNNKTNTVWLGEKIYESKAYSLKNATEKNNKQVLSKPLTIKPSKGINLTKGQYVIFTYGTPKDKTGSIYVSTYKPAKTRDFLIRYYGASNAANFLLKDRYFEVWYDKNAKIEVEEEEYNTSGSITSGTTTWANDEPIETVTVNGSISTPSGCSYKIYADTGGGWTQLTVGKATTMKGGGKSFKWKIELIGNKKSTPKISFNEKNNYAINFTITKKTPQSGGTMWKDSGECVTTKTFYPNDILKKYIGDENFSAENRFSNYEFMSLWADNNDGELLCDIHASDRQANVSTPTNTISTTGKAPKSDVFDIYSLIYCDLKLSDFSRKSVDYSDYDEDVEYDEHNLRLKLDTDTSYNDNDVSIFAKNNLQYVVKKEKTLLDEGGTDYEENVGDDAIVVNETGNILLRQNPAIPISNEQNTLIAKITNQYGYSDFSKFSALRINYNLTGNIDLEENGILENIGFYISSAIEEDVPSIDLNNDIIEEHNIIREDGILPDLNNSQEDIINYYYGKIIEQVVIRNEVTYKVYYQYVKKGDTYELQQVHNLRPNVVYSIPQLRYSVEGNQLSVLIPIDKNNDWFTRVKEIGFLALSGDQGWNVPVDSILSINNIQGVVQGYNIIYNGSTNFTPVSNVSNHCNSSIEQLPVGDGTATDNVCNLQLYYKNLGHETLAYIQNNTTTTDFNHFGIQLACDYWLPKGALQIHLCTDDKGQNPAFTMDVPTLNYVYYGGNNGTINFTQIYKKVSDDVEIRSISISSTQSFREKMTTVVGDGGPDFINVYINNITLYESETMPIFHPVTRMKLYSRSEPGVYNSPSIRKVGAVLIYK